MPTNCIVTHTRIVVTLYQATDISDVFINIILTNKKLIKGFCCNIPKLCGYA